MLTFSDLDCVILESTAVAPLCLHQLAAGLKKMGVAEKIEVIPSSKVAKITFMYCGDNALNIYQFQLLTIGSHCEICRFDYQI